MPAYMTLTEYKSRTTIPKSLVESCTARGKDPAFWLAMHSSTIRARLVKRYAVDFSDPGPAPDQIIAWLIVLMDIDVWKCVGGNPEGRIDGWYDADATRVREELKEAADSKDGLFELPLRNTDSLGNSAVNVGGPMGYSEASPYTWTSKQREAARNE